MKKNWLLWGAIAVGAYLIYKKMKSTNSNPTGREIAPPPVGTKPPVSPRPTTTGTTTEQGTIQEQL